MTLILEVGIVDGVTSLSISACYGIFVESDIRYFGDLCSTIGSFPHITDPITESRIVGLRGFFYQSRIDTSRPEIDLSDRLTECSVIGSYSTSIDITLILLTDLGHTAGLVLLYESSTKFSSHSASLDMTP